MPTRSGSPSVRAFNDWLDRVADRPDLVDDGNARILLAALRQAVVDLDYCKRGYRNQKRPDSASVELDGRTERQIVEDAPFWVIGEQCASWLELLGIDRDVFLAGLRAQGLLIVDLMEAA